MANAINYITRELGDINGPFTIPVDANFVVNFLEDLPAGINRLNGADAQIEPGQWNDRLNLAGLATAFAEDSQKKEYGLMYATKVNIPGETIGTDRLTVPEGAYGDTGILLGAPTLKNRSKETSLQIDFLETDASFADFVLRPWILAASQYGLFARKRSNSNQRHPQDFKRTMEVGWLRNDIPGAPVTFRKIFVFENCVPVSISSSEFSYGEPANVRTYKTTWIYTNYTVNSL